MKKQKVNSKLLHLTLRYCLSKRRKAEAHEHLLQAIRACTKKRQLKSVLLFGHFLQDEAHIRQAYRNRLLELDQQTTQKHLSKTS